VVLKRLFQIVRPLEKSEKPGPPPPILCIKIQTNAFPVPTPCKRPRGGGCNCRRVEERGDGARGWGEGRGHGEGQSAGVKEQYRRGVVRVWIQIKFETAVRSPSRVVAELQAWGAYPLDVCSSTTALFDLTGHFHELRGRRRGAAATSAASKAAFESSHLHTARFQVSIICLPVCQCARRLPVTRHAADRTVTSACSSS
jgi:hypothetical protein